MTHAASSSRRSREGWPDAEQPPEWAAAVHSHTLPPWLRRTVLAIGFVLLLFTVGLGALTYYVWLDHEYVMGRGQYRDAEAQRAREQTTEQIRVGICDLLDGLPAGPLLDPKRAEYGCGPGVAIDQLPPEAQEQLQEFSSSLQDPQELATPTPEPVTRPRQPAPETTDAPTPTPTVVAPPMAPDEPAASTPGLPPVSPAAPPLVDLTPLTDPLCTGLGLCL